MTQQLTIPFPPLPEKVVDYEAGAREELRQALNAARAATRAPPWDRRKQRYWRVVFPQMARWLPEEERTPMVAAFLVELDRIEGLFGPEVSQ